MATDIRIDEIIAKNQAFAQPILKHLRKLVHTACPDVEEKVKWGMPHFYYHGESMCHMAGFKAHCAFGFWKASLMKDTSLMQNAASESAMGHLGRITCLKDLPADKVILGYIKEAMQLNEMGIKVKKAPKAEVVVPAMPAIMQAALHKNKKANIAFEAFTPSHKKEYIHWIAQAKTEATQLKRLEQALEWIAEGKGRNWKYHKI